MKKFTVPCDFGGKMAPFTIYIGEPESTHHPLHFQADWLSKERGGTIPGDVMESLAKLFQLAKKNNLSFEELCVYTLNQTNSGQVQPKLEEASVEPVLETPNTPGIKDENAEDEKIEAVTASNNSFWPESKTHDENHAEETLSDEEFLSKVQDEAIFNEEDFFASLFADINNWEDEVEEEKTPLADNVADQNTDNLAAPETELSALEENYLQDTTATAPNLQELHDEILEEIPADNYDNFLVQPDEIKKAEFIEENDEEFEEETEEETEEENDDFETFLSTTNDDEENEDKIFGLGELTSEPEQPVIQSDVFYAEKSAEEDSHKLKNLSENFSKPEIKTEPEEENYFPQNQLEILQEELLQSNDIAEAEIIATNQTEVAQQKSDSEPTSAAATQNYTAEEYAAWQNYYQQYYQQYYQYYYQQQAQQQYQQQLMQYYQQMQAQQQYQQQQYYAQMQQQVTAQAQSLIQNNSAEIANHQLENIQSATMQAPASPAAVAPAVVAPAAAAPAVAAPIAAPAPKPAPNLPETTEF